MKNTTRLIALIIAVLMMTAMLAACTGAGKGTTTASGGTTTIPESTNTGTTESAPYVADPASDFEYEVFAGYISITVYRGNKTDVKIPDLIEGLPVTTIGGAAFSGYSYLTSVTIPSSVTTIGGSSFHNCYLLTNVTLGNSVTSIEGLAFAYCRALTSVKYRGTVAQWNAINKGSGIFEYSPVSAPTEYNYAGE